MLRDESPTRSLDVYSSEMLHELRRSRLALRAPVKDGLFASARAHFDKCIGELDLEPRQEAHTEQPIGGEAVTALVGLLHHDRHVASLKATERDLVGPRQQPLCRAVAGEPGYLTRVFD